MKILLVILLLFITTDFSSGQSRRSLKPCDSGIMASCFIAPCDGRTCTAFPQAECRNNYCGRCQPEFWVGDTEVTSQCDSPSGVRTGVAFGEECQGRTVRCFSDPCAMESCPGIPNAKCSTSPCTCSAQFTDNGADVTEQCRQSRNQDNTIKAGVTLGDECQGRTMQCFSNPCAFESCPGVPGAVCKTNPCTCAAAFSSNGADVTQQCRESGNQQVTRATLGDECQGRTMQCFSDPCAFELCPGVPGAVCKTNPCTCGAVFSNNGVDVTQKCKESRNQPLSPGGTLGDQCQGRSIQCFSDPCAFESCPGVPGAVCNTNPCTCAAAFSHNGADVTQQCRESKIQQVAQDAGDECQGRSIQCFTNACDHETCPSIPGAVCSTSPCTCAAKFTNNGADVTQQCKDSRSQTVNTGSTGVNLGEECQGRTVRCFSNSCAFASCSGVPDAVCRQSPCTCKAVFLLGEDDVTPRCQSDGSTSSTDRFRRPLTDLGLPPSSKVGTQQPKVADDCASNCLFPPCLYSFCAAHPSATCRNDYCNGCKAKFFSGSQEVTSICNDQIPSTGRARLFGGTSRLQRQRPTWQPQAKRFLSPWFSLFSAMFQ